MAEEFERRSGPVDRRTVPGGRAVSARFALLLGALAIAFFGRVLGQAIVALFSPGFLPPMEAWYSGLIPYSILLPIQVAILTLQLRISLDLHRGRGRFATPHRRFGVGLCWFSYIYAVAMIARWIVFGISIPVFFHWVLAAYLYFWSRFHTRAPSLTAH